MSNGSNGDSDVKQTRHRSPNHPLISLRKAVGRASDLYWKYKRHEVPVATAHTTWEYKEHSGVANQCVAALKSYGLLEVSGKAKDRKVKVTDRAERVTRKAPDRG